MEEIEAKYLDIDPDEIQKKLLAIGAVKKSEELIRQKVYDYHDWRLDKMGAWIRLRDTGSKVTLAYKQRLGMKDGVANDSGMEEIEVAVGEFEKTAMIMEKAGFAIKFCEEKKRITYTKGNIVFDIDLWPVLPPYLEIEGPSWEAIDKAAEDLGLDPQKKKILSAMQIFDIYGLREKDFLVLTFEKQVKRQN
ncbi:hypothetical protein A2701_01325 [Candidatus Amesbacteria bacterium RIFCSPHIGHO2_01_FULL_47_34]|nr:MAG: hypothetical protein A2701_01325 [Candidatus Amesbacteria bacterium RIFCSPHIGHO2_01_FULL_47_34]